MLVGCLMATAVTAAVAADIITGMHFGILALSLVAVVVGCREYARMARVHASHVQMLPMIVVAVLLTLEAHLHGNAWPGTWVETLGRLLEPHPVATVILALGVLWTVIVQMTRFGADNFTTNVAGTVFGMLYLGVSMALLERLALLSADGDPHRGMALIAIYLATCKLGDVAAYFGGKAFGRNKMSPSISPGKTWEGFACSFVGSIGGAYLIAGIIHACGQPWPFSGWWQPAVWGLVLGPLGAAGDLAESCLKRVAAFKDSGTALPGFGGFLDVLDALLIAAPVAYLLALVL